MPRAVETAAAPAPIRGWDADDVCVLREFAQLGLQLASPEAAQLMSRTVRAAVERVLEEASDDRVSAALALLALTRELDLAIDVERAQELVFDALTNGRNDAGIRRLGDALRVAIDR